MDSPLIVTDGKALHRAIVSSEAGQSRRERSSYRSASIVLESSAWLRFILVNRLRDQARRRELIVFSTLEAP